MDVYGIDFTSAPSRRKPITCRHCQLEGDVLRVLSASAWSTFEEFEAALARPGPWIAGIDFPFGMPRRFIADTGWPVEWSDYVRHAAGLGKEGFEAALNAYRKRQPVGQKEHRRRTDELAGSLSPQKLYGTPVGKMFFQGAPRLQQAGVSVPGLQQGDRLRVVVEGYPGVLACSVTKAGYKHDRAKKQTIAQRDARHGILRALTSGRLAARYGVTVAGDDPELVDDPTGDTLDALLCAVQAAWAWRNRARLFGNPRIDRFEGWITDPGGVPGAEPRA